MEFHTGADSAKLPVVATEARLVVNLTRGTVVCDEVTIADRPGRRMRGLLGRRSLPEGEGLLLQPAPSIHTAFMSFPIDVVFIDGTLRVLKVVEGLAPWRTASARRARAVLELASGEARRRAIAIGDQLGILEVDERLGPVEPRVLGDGRVHPFARHRIAQRRSALSPDGAERPGEAPGDNEASPTRVLLIAQDRRFRTVAAALLTRRGCAVTVGDGAGAGDRRDGKGSQVVILDVGSSLADAIADTFGHGVGVVLVGDEPVDTDYRLPVVAKWGAFDRLYDAVEHAARAGAPDGSFDA